MTIKGVSPILWGGVVTVVVAAAVLGYLHQMKSETSEAEEAATATPSSTSSHSATASASAEPTPITDAGVTWSTPTKQEGLALIKVSDGADVVYYKVGSYNGRDIIVSEAKTNGINIYPLVLMFVKNEGKSTYSVLSKYNKEDVDLIQNDGKEGGLTWGEGVAIDTTLSFQSVAAQTSLTVKGAILNLNTVTGIFDAQSTQKDVSFEKLATTAYGPVYLEKLALDDGTRNEKLMLQRFDGTGVRYDIPLNGILDDSRVGQFTWNDNTQNKDTYRQDGKGACGIASGANIAVNVTSSELIQAGKTVNGKPVYEFKDTEHKILKGWYAMLNEGKYYDSTAGKEVSISYAEWLKKHPVVIVSDALGRNLVLRNTVYGLQAECGKPVVYLYPEKATQVSVKVGADITVSEPAYGQGWEVLAQSNGRLTTADGKVWPNLFWEGQGDGPYPEITAGTVVKRSEVISTLKKQMTELGLNAQEQADFLEFWQEKLPTTPYTRLTWFGTREMDRLAPLTVEPQPDTSIRVFLDFEGLQAPISLPAQKLSSPKRTGFTLVEWGGLLRR